MYKNHLSGWSGSYWASFGARLPRSQAKINRPGCMLEYEMRAKHFRWLFLPLLAALVVVMLSRDAPYTIGLSGEFSQDKYRIAGGTAPWALTFAILIISLFFSLMCARPAEYEPMPSGWLRRTIAFWIDFVLAVTAVGAVLGTLPMVVEWRRTGVFVWNFERTTPAPGDALLSVFLFVLAVPALVFYYALPLVRGRPSPGACVMGYQIVADEGVALTWDLAIKRTLWGWTSFLGDRKRTKLRIDESYKTHAVKLE